MEIVTDIIYQCAQKRTVFSTMLNRPTKSHYRKDDFVTSFLVHATRIESIFHNDDEQPQ